MHFKRWRTKLVKSFDEGLIPNFAETWGIKNIFNPNFYLKINYTFSINNKYNINYII